jgi:hypothetical protein
MTKSEQFREYAETRQSKTEDAKNHSSTSLSLGRKLRC